MRARALSLLQELTDAPGAPGNEDAIRKIIHRELNKGARHSFETDRSGNLLCRRSGESPASPRVMITAHMDEVAFMVQNITDDGFIQFVPLGGWWAHVIVAQAMHVVTRDGRMIPGCISSTPPHFLPDEAKKKLLDVEQMFLDVGGSSRRQVEEDMGIRLGDSIVPATRFQEMAAPDHFMAKAFDNRVGVASLIQAMEDLAEETLPCQVLGVATVQEELGCRGAVTAAALAKPEFAIILEGPPADDTPGFKKSECQGALGKGVQIRVMDPSALSSRSLVDFAVTTAQANGIPHQLTVRRGGGTDAKSFQFYGLGVPCVVLGVPSRYIHCHHSIIHLADYLAVLELTTAMLRAFNGDVATELTRFL